MNEHGNEKIEGEAFGIKVRAEGWRLISDKLLGVLLLALFLLLGYKHHIDTEAVLGRILESNSEMTYMLSLKQQDRENLNIVMPDSLRRRLGRHHESRAEE